MTDAVRNAAAQAPTQACAYGAGSCRRAAALLAILALVGCWGDDDAPASSEKIAFHGATLDRPAPVLSGDPSSGRCPDPSQPCFKDNKDVMKGQHQLFRVDDLGVVIHTQAQGGDDSVQALSLLTKNSAMVSQGGDASPGVAPASSTSTIAADGGRLTAEARDRYVFAKWDGRYSYVQTDQGKVLLQFDSGASASPPMFNAVDVGADFNRDGLKDVALAYGDRLTVMSLSADGGAGPSLTAQLPQAEWPLAMAVGDFFGTGNMIATASVTPNNPSSVRVSFYSVDFAKAVILRPAFLDLRIAAEYTLLPSSVAIASGRFGGVQQDQLIVAVTAGSANGGSVALFGVGTDASGNAVQLSTTPQFASSPAFGRLALRSGRIDATRGLDAVALLVGGDAGNQQQLVLATFDANLGPTIQGSSPVLVLGDICIRDIQLGNFDRQQPDPTRPNQGYVIRDPNLQLALLVSSGAADCSGQDLYTWVQSILVNLQQPSGKQYSLAPPLLQQLLGWDNSLPLQDAKLVPYDRQGRSMVLGEPDIVTIENRAQVGVALGAPPMHVDLFDGKVFNVSAAPGGFYANFESGSDDKVSTATTQSTTYSFAAEESASFGLTEGNCDLGDCVNVDDKFSAKQAVDGSSKQLSGSFTQTTTDLSAQTGFSDLIQYVQSTLTIYVYPVIGKTVCPAAKPNCSDADKVPLTVMVAGPDTTVDTQGDGSLIPWYQPPWMPGNMLSYPGNLAQLSASAWNDPKTFAQLSVPVRWQTDSSTTEAHTRWTQGGSTGTTSELNQNYSFENSISISGQVSAVVVSARAGASFDVSGSFGFGRLTDSSNDTSNSTGIGFTKKAVFADPALYSYFVTPYLFGQTQPPGAGGDSAPSADLQVWGTLRSSYIVDPLSSGAGSIWRQRYASLPDLAFNQPARWRVAAATSDRGDGSCLLFDRATSDVQCASLAGKDPADPWTDEYHLMRGFFIGPASANGASSQLSVATAGDQLLLQARVHNFSFAAMPAGARVKVRIHVMPWDASTSRPAGKSVVVGTGTSPLGVVPPFNVDTAQPNWVLVGVPFDTTPYENQDLVFWAVTWIEDANGSLVAEMADKGLSAIPDASLDFAGVATLEQQFGNNLGFFNQILHIDAKPSAAPTPKATSRPSVAVSHVGVQHGAVSRGQRTLVGARLQMGETDVEAGITAHFYDGDPAHGGRLFGVQSVPVLRAGRTYDLRVPYRSSVCGSHDLYVVAGPRTRFEHAAKIDTVAVSCS